MSDLVLFTGNTQIAMPAYFADVFGGESNIPPKMTVPQLSIKGGKFRIMLDGEETVMTRHDPDTGESMPLTSVKLVVLNQGKRSARTYHVEKYNPDNPTPPVCFSLDGEKPDASIKEPQSTNCANCPKAQKGSKISEASGKAISACAMQRRLVVVPASKLGFEPLLVRLAPTSAWDKNNESNESQGWYAWQQYLDFIAARGVKHTAQVVTMVKFDPNTEYPKLLFKPERLLTAEEAVQLKDVWNSAKVQALLTASENEAVGGGDHVEEPKAEQAPAPKVEKAKATSKPKPAPAPAPEVDEAAPAPASKPNEGKAALMAALDEW